MTSRVTVAVPVIGRVPVTLKMNKRGKTVSLNMTQKTLTIPHSHSGRCLVSLVTFENAGTSLVVLVVRFFFIVAQPTTIGRGGNAFEVTF